MHFNIHAYKSGMSGAKRSMEMSRSSFLLLVFLTKRLQFLPSQRGTKSNEQVSLSSFIKIVCTSCRQQTFQQPKGIFIEKTYLEEKLLILKYRVKVFKWDTQYLTRLIWAQHYKWTWKYLKFILKILCIRQNLFVLQDFSQWKLVEHYSKTDNEMKGKFLFK